MTLFCDVCLMMQSSGTEKAELIVPPEVRHGLMVYRVIVTRAGIGHIPGKVCQKCRLAIENGLKEAFDAIDEQVENS